MVDRFIALFVVTGVVATAQTSVPFAADKRLTAVDVTKVVGFPVTQVAPSSRPGAGPGLNFAGPDGKLVLMVNFSTADLYQRAKNQKEMTIAGQTVPMPLFHQAVAGLGDEAFDSPPGPLQYVLYVRKGNQAISLSSFVGLHNKTALTMEQLKALARVVVLRM